ncbi:MAG: hypothetical protein AAF665_11240 [Pseudomonadota bacterium]
MKGSVGYKIRGLTGRALGLNRTQCLALAVPLALASCTDIQNATDKAGRDAAKTIMPEALAIYFPQVPKELYTPFTNCVVDFATASEVQTLASDAVIGIDQATADTIRQILARPDTQNCLQQAAPDAAATLG